MGRTVNEEAAKSSVCTCYLIDPDKPPTDENLLCHVDGVIGFTNDDQEARFCGAKAVVGEMGNYSDGAAEQREKFSKLGEITDICFESKVEDTWECVEREARKMKKKEENHRG